jgi:hypothetical protein
VTATTASRAGDLQDFALGVLDAMSTYEAAIEVTAMVLKKAFYVPSGTSRLLKK